MKNTIMRLFVKSLCAIGVLFVAVFPLGNKANALNVAASPSATVSIIHSKFVPLIEYLKREGIPESRYIKSHNFHTFVQQAKKYEFDIAYVDAGYANFLSNQLGYIPLLVSEKYYSAVMIVRNDSPYNSVHDVTTSKVYLPMPYDLVHALGKEMLLHKSSTPITLSSINQIIMSVLRSKTVVGVVADIDIQLLTPTLRNQIRVIGYSDSTSNIFIMLNPKLLSDFNRFKELFMQLHEHLKVDTTSSYFINDSFVKLKENHFRQINQFSEFADYINSQSEK